MQLFVETIAHETTYKTIEKIAEGYYTEKRSKFFSFAIPVRNTEEVKKHVEKFRKEYLMYVYKMKTRC